MGEQKFLHIPLPVPDALKLDLDDPRLDPRGIQRRTFKKDPSPQEEVQVRRWIPRIINGGANK